MGKGYLCLKLREVAQCILKPSIAESYFTKPKGRPSTDVQSAMASLRGTLKSLQVSHRITQTLRLITLLPVIYVFHIQRPGAR